MVGFQISWSRLDRVSAAAEWENSHDLWLLSCEELERRARLAGGAGGTVQDIDGVLGCEVPERNGGAARDEVGAHLLHDAANGPFGDSIQRMHVRRARGLLNGFGVEEFLLGTGAM